MSVSHLIETFDLLTAFILFADIIGGGHGAAARILAQYLVMYNVPPGMIGQPRKNRRGNLAVDGDHEYDNDDDRPEVDNEPELAEKQLEGLILRIFYCK